MTTNSDKALDLETQQPSVKIVREQTHINDLQYYQLLRDHVEHEDNLINQRISWLLLYNGFVVIGFVNLLNALRETTHLVQGIGILAVIWTISIFSILVTRYIRRLVSNADTALYNLQLIAERQGLIMPPTKRYTPYFLYFFTRTVNRAISLLSGLLPSFFTALEKRDYMVLTDLPVNFEGLLPPILWRETSLNPHELEEKNPTLYGILDTIVVLWAILMLASVLVAMPF